MITKLRRLSAPYTKHIVAIVCVVLVLVVVAKVTVWSKRFMDETGLTPMSLVRLVFNTGVALKQTDGRTNILILGIAGGTHAGADLTDTIIVLSLDQKKHTGAFLSVPRDIWSDTLRDKINSAYHYGEEKKNGGGVVLSKVVIEDVVGMPIHYVLLIDFSGFEEIINLVGGVTVGVPQAFTDSEFPVTGKENDPCDGDPLYRCRYETLTYEAGDQVMNGERALKYVRSRHAEGQEGSDFARSRRQQDVLVAVKEKLLTPRVYLSPTRLSELVGAFDQATETDLRIGELATIAKILTRIPQEHIIRVSLEDQLTNPPLWLYGRYVLVPKESWEKLQAGIKEKIFLPN